MSSLGPDGSFLDERPTSRVPASPFAAHETATDISAAPLWTAFRDRYTRAKERRHSPPADGKDSAGERPERLESAPTTGIEVLCCI